MMDSLPILYKDYRRTCPPIFSLIQLANLCYSDRYKVGSSLLYFGTSQLTHESERHSYTWAIWVSLSRNPVSISIVVLQGFFSSLICRKPLYVLDIATPVAHPGNGHEIFGLCLCEAHSLGQEPAIKQRDES